MLRSVDWVLVPDVSGYLHGLILIFEMEPIDCSETAITEYQRRCVTSQKDEELITLIFVMQIRYVFL